MQFFLLALFFSMSAHALQIPKGLTQSDRQDVVETIGLGAAQKMLTNPYPLGGYSGFEVGLSVEFINVREINKLGCSVGSVGCGNTRVSTDDEFRYSRISIGKGLYQDIDIFLTFVPALGGSNVSDYGGSVRWAFYQAEFLPITFSMIVHGNRMNVQDTFIDENFGAELIAGLAVDNFSLYFGGGQIWSTGTFLPGNSGNGTVDPGDPAAQAANATVTERVRETHTLVGISLKYENLFTATEIDHYKDSVYSLKLGTRF
jgi:hypothetical protein